MSSPLSSLRSGADSSLVSTPGPLVGGAVSWRSAHPEGVTYVCRLLEALVSFLDFSDKKANSAMGLLTDLALQER